MALEHFLAYQDGLLRREQAIASGFTPAAIRHRLRPGGPWQRVLPEVFTTFTGDLTERQRCRAALLYAGDDALITGRIGCVLHGLRYVPQGTEPYVDLLVPAERNPRSREFVRVHRTLQMPAWTVVDGLLVSAAAARCAVDTARELQTLRDVRALLCEVVQRRRARVNEVAAEVARGQRRGLALMRRAVEDLEAGCRSAPECELRDLVGRSRILPEPRWNKVLPGGPRIFPDACWPQARLVVEVNSKEYHRYGEAAEETEQRLAVYAANDWRAIPLSPARLRAETREVRAQIEAAYLAGLRWRDR